MSSRKIILLMFLISMSVFSGNVEAAKFAYSGNAFINIIGPIVPGDYQRFVDTIKSSRRDVASVMTIGPGGSVDEALQIGRLIRKLNLSTYTIFTEDYAPDARRLYCNEAANIDLGVGCACASACFLIWLSGTQRSGNDLLIHCAKYNEKYYGSMSAQAASNRFRSGMKDVRSYFEEMDVPIDVFNLMYETPAAFVTRLPSDKYLQLSQMIPAYREWVSAKCSMFEQNSVDFALCWNRVTRQSAVDAVNEFRQEEQQPE